MSNISIVSSIKAEETSRAINAELKIVLAQHDSFLYRKVIVALAFIAAKIAATESQ
mgnify:CR=1 FL=1